VAERALALGAHMLNDITGLRDRAMIDAAARHQAAVVIMHMKGKPKMM
jgi:dihydropteroate synthase